MWATIQDDKVRSEGLLETNCIAAAQIHAVEARDAFVIRIADALCIDSFETAIAPNDSVTDPSQSGARLASHWKSLRPQPVARRKKTPLQK